MTSGRKHNNIIYKHNIVSLYSYTVTSFYQPVPILRNRTSDVIILRNMPRLVFERYLSQVVCILLLLLQVNEYILKVYKIVYTYISISNIHYTKIESPTCCNSIFKKKKFQM